MSGSLLRVELNNVLSMPVGYMKMYNMYPLDFEEFCIANGVSEPVFDHVKKCFEEKISVHEAIYESMMKIFNLYLIIGGMPSVVKKYLDTNNLKTVEKEQQSIVQLYKKDIAKYDKSNQLELSEIYSLIPSELNNQNKRFIMKNLNENFRFKRSYNRFLWLKDAGVAHPIYCANEAKIPLILSKSRNLFKLFLSDVGLLSCLSCNGIQIKILKGEVDINYGALYENVVAQELVSKEFNLYYYKNKKIGE